MHSNFLVPVFSIFMGLLLMSCQGPDLVPERRSGGQGSEGFCRRDGQVLTVRVRNQGNEDVLILFKTTVQFGSVTKSAMTSPMPSGSFSDVTFDIPAGCFDPDCDFKITVDADNDIEESIESNNVEAGICIG